MVLKKGARSLFEWLKTLSAGTVVSYDAVMTAANWSDKSLRTYISKNKISPFLTPIPGDNMKVLLDGGDISEQFFHETFTQSAPRRVVLSSGDQLTGEADTYTLQVPIGQGAVGQVWTAKRKSDSKLVAAKLMLPKQDLLQDSQLPNVRERFRQEARNGQSLAHSNLVEYLDFGSLEKNPFLVMELAERSVADQLKASGAIPEEEAAEILTDCLAGLEHLHAKGCPHRDIKPANLLLFQDCTKVGDLGIVRWNDFDPVFTHGGTITRESVQLGSWFYMAPEQQESPHDAVLASDIYSLGVTWIEMLTNALPAPQAVGAGRLGLTEVPVAISDIVRKMCSYDANERPSISDIRHVVTALYG